MTKLNLGQVEAQFQITSRSYGFHDDHALEPPFRIGNLNLSSMLPATVVSSL
ncbi:hypothetical protein [Nostoc sp.]|uniref:hypothetical protein n=1 Tax=Nostoc sp. TaxID=1180 RepID=UPI002A646364|nr:hypothetical protein [Nostoc sp. S13]